MSYYFNRLVSSIALLLLFFISSHTLAWGDNTHRAIAQMSLHYLSDESKTLLKELYGEDEYLEEYILASTWADLEARQDGKHWKQRYHYVFFEFGDTEFDKDQHCKNNQCSVGGFLASTRILQANSRSLSERRQAMSYIIHLVGDIHQPMNAGNVRDKGGEKIVLEQVDLTTVNLRWVWERGLDKTKASGWFTQSNALRLDMDDEDKEEWMAELDPTKWIVETRNIAINKAYAFALNKTYDAEYIANAMPIYDQQVQKSAVRLAGFINSLTAEKANETKE
jgi:hypothetical protein